MEIIVPAAGFSTRFPLMKPKYLLYDYKHHLMIENALKYYMNFPITIGILREHDQKYNSSSFISHTFGSKVKVVILEEPTKGPADTVYQILKKNKISGEIFIKDCDSFFDHIPSEGNYVCISNIANHNTLKKIKSKSFVLSNNQGIITSIIEKSVVSENFCVGGYKFECAQDFLNAFENLNKADEIFVSDIIERLIYNKNIFYKKEVSEYIDVGTSEEWFEYNNKPLFICDIDGTIIKAQSRVGDNSYKNTVTPLKNNIKALLEYQKKGSQFIFTTSRDNSEMKNCRKLLDSLGFENYHLITGLLNSKRILINDFNEANPFPRAESINLYRDTDNLSLFLSQA